MILQHEDTQRFYRIWFPLLTFVNARKNLVSNWPAQPLPGSIKPEDAGKVRDALWAEVALLDQFITENPAALPFADLELVASWKHRVVGKFFVVKHLKKYSVFLDDRELPHAYGVLGLVSPIEEIVGSHLPILVQVVLLPFEGRITYDSLIAPYNIFFGGGIRARLKTTLRDAEEREGIITALIPRGEPATDEAQGDARTRNDKLIAEFRKALYKSGLSPKMVEQHAGNIENFVGAFLQAQDPPRLLLEVTAKDVEHYLISKDSEEGKAASKSFKRFVRFLWDTERSDPETLTALDRLLKPYQRETR